MEVSEASRKKHNFSIGCRELKINLNKTINIFWSILFLFFHFHSFGLRRYITNLKIMY